MTKTPEQNETSLLRMEDAAKEIAELRKKVDELSELADLMPLVTGFREHLDEERQKNRARLTVITGVFVTVSLILLCLPLYMSRAFIRETQSNYTAQLALQQELGEALSSGLEAMNRSNVEMKEEWLRDRRALLGIEEPAPQPELLPPSVERALAIEDPVSREAALEELLGELETAIAERGEAPVPVEE